MSIWLCKEKENLNLKDLENYGSIQNGDTIYVYSEDNINGGFSLIQQFTFDGSDLIENESFSSTNIDLPYTLFYQTKRSNRLIQINKNEIDFILQNTGTENQKDIRELFADYINHDWNIETKKVEKRIEYLDKILPERLDSENPISIFEIFDINKLKDIVNTLKKGHSNYEWDRSKGGGGEIQQTLNQYIKFVEKMKNEDFDEPSEEIEDDSNIVDLDKDRFQSFIKKIEYKEEAQIDKKWKNIEFVIGQPNTGKSYNFEESRLLNIKYKDNYRYKKIPVSGGIGNEYKGLQNTDLALTFDPIKEEIKFGEFLQVLMSAIANPKVPHVIFLDDFHNQDISSLMSEYTPLFKSQQMRDIGKVDTEHEIFTRTSYADADEFIKTWNNFVESNCNDIPQVPLTNRISGESLNLVFPSNFYLLGAANFNENTLNIFADWEDRAKITYKDPIETFDLENDESGFVECCKKLNTNLRLILEKNNIFDYEKYCFGMWKIVDSEGKPISQSNKQAEVFKFLFGMIKNALRFNNKNSEINKIGWNLITNMYSSSDNEWFKTFLKKELKDKELDYTTDEISYKYKVLHKLNIYEDEI
ncbi:hypothetical protein [Sulfurovum sp. AR]|uniref:hypothetical protein n=1 Tax=Sulfurovum sp. AR TaxID=1165841 RepID=UPI00025C4D3E|nr:hypothetical protein [Sulfurovum sp. AR]EIF51378.1 polysulfide reductase chain C (sulfur reductase chain C) [Sulfurovum sp. AR]